jgi:Co/Zn/Cd efflux system component
MKILEGTTPLAQMMGGFGALALLANLACLALLWPLRTHDVNLRSTFECSRNDVIADLGVLLAAAGVWITQSALPDFVVGAIVAALFLRSSVSVLCEAWPQFMVDDDTARRAPP